MCQIVTDPIFNCSLKTPMAFQLNLKEGALLKQNTRTYFAHALLLGFLLLGFANRNTEASELTGWLRECPEDAFCFDRPASLIRQPGQAIDSLSARYRNSKLTLTFDMGQYPLSVSHLANPKQEAIVIDGRPAQLFFSENEAILIVPRVHEKEANAIKFSMTLKFSSNISRDLALRTFQSIEFKPPR